MPVFSVALGAVRQLIRSEVAKEGILHQKAEGVLDQTLRGLFQTGNVERGGLTKQNWYVLRY